MLRTDLLLGRFERVESIGKTATGELVRAFPPEGAPAIVLLSHSRRLQASARDALIEVAGPGVPVAEFVRDAVSGRAALVLQVPDDVACLESWDDLPPATLRAGLVQLLGVLSRAHSRGRVHGSVAADAIVASAAGEFWLIGWGSSRRVDEPSPSGTGSSVAADVRDLGRAFVAALLRLEQRREDDVQALSDLSGLGAGKDFQRVLSRLVASDPRDAYGSAGEVLADLGQPDTLDPWQSRPYVEHGDSLARVLGAVDAAREECGVAVEVVGPSGSGRSRLLTVAASRIRAHEALVLQAEAAGCPWGGLRSLARQMTQLVGRDGTAWEAHGALLEHVTADDGVPTDGRVLPVAAALTELAIEAFAGGRGALVLDDEDLMPPNAAETWRSLRRQVAARTEARVLFLSSRVRAATAMDDARREVVELHGWSRAEVQHFLEGVLVNPGIAVEAAPIMRDLAGGRPAEIVGLLRDLERGGALVRVGARWRLEIPLHGLPEWTPSEPEVVRRALRVAGRDAAALAGVLAVAGQPISRADCGRLSELPGPRLWAGAERAEAVGILRRDGETWRLRSEHIRRRVLAAMPPARRCSLHREMLALLRSSGADCLPGQAWHARAAGHPDADELTRRAVDELTAGAYFDSAVAQLIDAEDQLGEPRWGRSAWAERVELLRFAGRLGEALALADLLIAHPDTSAEERADALVRRIHVLYESRDWDAVLAQELPERAGSAEQLAELRYMRAAACVELRQERSGERELRLAAAEWGDSAEPAAIALARLESRYKQAFYAEEFATAARALLGKVRIWRAAGARWSAALDLARLAALGRRCAERPSGRAILTRAGSILEAVPEGARHVRAIVTNALCLATEGVPDSLLAEAQLRFANLYEQTSAPILVSTARVRRIFVRSTVGVYRRTDAAELREVCATLDTASDSMLLAWSHALSAALLAHGIQPALERFAARLRPFGQRLPRVRPVLEGLLRGRFLWSDPVVLPPEGVAAGAQLAFPDPGAAASQAAARALPPATPARVSMGRGDAAVLAAAWQLRTGRDPGVWDPSPGPSLSACAAALRVESPDGGEVALALALGIWHAARLSPADLAWVRWVRSAYDGDWFPPLRWQAHLLDCKLQWRAGELAESRRSLRLAAAAAHDLSRERFGEWGARERAYALRSIRERAPAPLVASAPTGAVVAPESARPKALAVATAPAPCSSATVVLHAASAWDLEHELRTTHGVAVTHRLAPGTHRVAGVDVVFLPELQGSDEIRRSFALVQAASETVRRVIVCTTLRVEEVDAAPFDVRALVRAAQGPHVQVAASPATGSERVMRFRAAVAAQRRSLSVSPAACALVARHDWPGGTAEVERVAVVVAETCAREVRAADLVRAGLGSSAEVVQGLDAATSAILGALRARTSCSVRELQRASGASRRTLQRRLAALVADGVLERVGQGRSVRYRARSTQA